MLFNMINIQKHYIYIVINARHKYVTFYYENHTEKKC